MQERTVPVPQVEPGVVILLNGPSASGKTSLQKKIQEHFDEPYLRIGIDGFFDALLPDYYGLGEIHPKGKFSEKDIRYIETIEVEGKTAIKLTVGPIGKKVIYGMHRAIADYARAGNNVVVDYILYDPDWFPDLVANLKGIKTYYVGVSYPLQILEEREKARATSPVGHARSHYQTVHTYGKYDFTISDSTLTSEQLAIAVKNFVGSTPNPQAFKTYQETF